MINFILLLLMLFSPASASLQGVDIFNTGGFACTPERHLTYWENDIGDIRIYNAKLWMGADYEIVADVGAIVFVENEKNRNVLFHENWDRYAEPTGLHVNQLNLTPNYIEVGHGEKIGLAYWCNQFNEPAKRGHVIVTVWYSKPSFGRILWFSE